MAVTYITTLKTTRMQDVVTAIGTSGKLVIMTAADAVLCTIALSSTAGTVSNGVLTFSGTPLTGTATGAGTAAKAKITTSADADVITGLTVSTTGADVNLSTTTIAVNNVISLTAASITHG